MKPSATVHPISPSPIKMRGSLRASSPIPSLSPQLSSLTIGRWFIWVGGAFLLAMMALAGCLGFGTEVIAFSQIGPLLLKAIIGETTSPGSVDPGAVILFQVRLPRVLLAFLVGGSLAAVGVALQALLRNPLADPFVLGISSGAALGAAIALLFGVGLSVWSLSALPVFGFVGALVALLILYRISSTPFGFSVYTLLLAGVILGAIFSALIMFLTSVSEPHRAFGMYAWLMGSLTGPDYPTLGILLVYLGLGLLVLASQAQALNVLTMGEEAAKSLGVEVERVKKMVFVATALMTGAVVAFSGLIGFVGLIVPHAVRLAVSADHRLLFPLAGLTGGIFLMVADTAARTLMSPSEIPVGVITAIIGGPVFLYLLINRRARVMT